MQKIGSETDLKAAILQLEINQAAEGRLLKEQFHLAHESIRPINLIKSTFDEVAASHSLKNNILNTAVGLAAGYISEKIFVRVSSSPFKKFLGTALLFGITNVVAKNPETVKALGSGLAKIIRSQLAGRKNKGLNPEKLF